MIDPHPLAIALSCAALALAPSPLHAQEPAPVTGAPTVPDAGTDGHIHIVSSSGPGTLGLQVAWAGVGFAGLGIVTLFGEALVVLSSVASIACLGATVTCMGGPPAMPPAELTWTALGVIGAGIVTGLIGLFIVIGSQDGPRVRRPIADLDGALRF